MIRGSEVARAPRLPTAVGATAEQAGSRGGLPYLR